MSQVNHQADIYLQFLQHELTRSISNPPLLDKILVGFRQH